MSIFTHKKLLLVLTRLCRDTIQVRWETFALLCSTFIQDTMYQLLLVLAEFYRSYDKKFLTFSLDTVYKHFSLMARKLGHSSSLGLCMRHYNLLCVEVVICVVLG